jgi:trk system potassium uptake protein TrkH
LEVTRLARFVGSLVRHPARLSFLWYAAVAILGAIVLSRTACRAPDAERITYLDAAFTSTSALCVTGLTVRSTGHDFSWLGQAVILALIQIGGIGIITVTTFLTLTMGGKQTLHNRTLLANTLGAGREPDLRWVLSRVVRFTLWFELAGAVLLSARFMFDYPPLEALWQGVFHSISAFCNAGFSLNDSSLMAYQGDWWVNLTIMVLIISGGIGYPVMIDLSRHWHRPWQERWEPLMLHTKLMIIGTAALLVFGTLSVLVLESENALRGMNWPRRLLISAFQSVTCRTAGFNTVDIGSLTNATLFVSMLLMVIGAGPCSTAGGFKVSTFSVLVLRAWATFRGYSRVNFARRTLPEEMVDAAVATALVFTVVTIVGLTGILALEQSIMSHDQTQGVFLDASFEVVSALGTVGLSTGLTQQLTDFGKVIIIALMFIGRLGPITVAAVFTLARRTDAIAYACEEPLIG